MRVHHVNDTPVDLDKHRGMAEQKATDIHRVLAEVEVNAKVLRDQQGMLETVAAPAASWSEAAAKARYVLTLYAASLTDTRRRDLVAAVIADFARLSDEG